MRLLVTGSSGLVGSAVLRRLTNLGHDPVPFDVRHHPVQDLRDQDAIHAAIAGCDGVIHLAAVSRVAWGELDPETCDAVNIGGTASVLKAALAQKTPPFVLFASSREVYGEMNAARVTEEATRRPVNAYGHSKAEAERLCEAARSDGLRLAILRLSNVYGGREDHPDRAVPSLVAAALRGAPLHLTGGGTYFDFVHTDDVVTGIEATLNRLGEGEDALPTMHLTTGVPTSLRSLAEAAIAETGSMSPIDVRSPRAFDVTGFCGDPARAERVLGWRADIPLAEGLRRVVRDIEANGSLAAVLPPPARVFS